MAGSIMSAVTAGYQIGSDMRKRKATGDYFKEFKKLTEEDDEEMVAEDGAAIPVAKSKADTAEAEPVATEAIPIGGDGKAEVQVDSPATSPTEAAIPAEGMTGAAEAEAPAPAAALPAAPAAPAADMQAALPVGAPAEAKAAAKEADKVAAKKSLTQADIKRLDRLALKAAEASGDLSVYTALQQTTDSFLQGKVQKYLGMAQTAAQNNPEDVDAIEKFIGKAYRFIPDGEELKVNKRDGKLWVANPWAEGKDDPKEIQLGAEQIGWINLQISNPEKWGDIMRQERAALREAKLKERGVAVEEKKGDAYVKMTDAQITNMADRLGLDKEELKIKGRAQALDEINSRVTRFATFNQGLYYSALAENTKLAGKAGAGGLTLDQLMDNARQMTGEVDKQFNDYTTPPKDMYGQPDRNWQKPADLVGLSDQQIQQAGGLAQAFGAANMTSGDFSPGLALSAGLALARAGVKDENGNPLNEVDVDAKAGTMTFDHNGRPTTVKLPGAVLQSLIAVEAAKRQGSQAGLPAPVQFQDPFAPPAPLFGQQP